MRTLTPSLLAAAQSLRGRAAVRVSVHNKRRRWTTLHSGAASDLYTDTETVGNTLRRCRVTAAGAVQFATVTDPAVQAQWETWSAVTTGAANGGDCALAVDAANANNLRIFYADSSYIHVVESTNAGVTWGSPAHVAAITTAAFVGAANLCVFFVDASGVVKCYSKPYGSGSWTAKASWTTHTFTTPTGLGAQWDAAHSFYYVAIAGDAVLWHTLYTPASNTWGPTATVAPGGSGTATHAQALRAPSALMVEDDADWRLLVGYIDDYGGALGEEAQPVVSFSLGGTHSGDEVAVACLAATAHRRTALAQMGGYVYAANNCTVCRAKVYADDDTTQNLSNLQVETYTRHTTLHGSQVWLTLIDRPSAAGQDAWRIPGKVGTAGECLKPLAEIVVERGYGVGQGTGLGHEEWTALGPHYITRVQAAHGRGGKRVQIEAMDGLRLLHYWHAPDTMTWTGKTIAWLAAEICACVGLTFSCPVGELTTVVPTFTMAQDQSAINALLDVLGLASAVPWTLSTGEVYATELTSYAPVTMPQVGDHGEILRATFAAEIPAYTATRVIGDNGPTFYWSEDYAPASMALGLRLVQTIDDPTRIDALTTAQDIAAYHAALTHELTRLETVTVPLRPDVEMYDLAQVLDAEVVEQGDNMRRVVSIREDYDGAGKRCTSTLQLRGY